jgi:hypothetical protein
LVLIGAVILLNLYGFDRRFTLQYYYEFVRLNEIEFGCGASYAVQMLLISGWFTSDITLLIAITVFSTIIFAVLRRFDFFFRLPWI